MLGSAVGAAGGLVLVGALVVLVTNSLEVNDSYGSIVGALVAIGTAFVGVVVYLRRPEAPVQVDQEAEALVLELLGQWEPEVTHRRQRFGSSRIIPLTWVETKRGIAPDPAEVVGGDVALGTVRLKLDGRLDGNPDTAARKLARAFDRIPSKRLVMLGEPGAGKTFLGITLTVGLLRERVVGAPVPVFLSLSSWDPVADSLDEWIVQGLAAAHYGGRQRVPRALLTRRLLLPVLDGLDELPEHHRRQAISRINDTLDGDRPLVLTCRLAEYVDGLEGGAPMLLRAPVVEVEPVSTADIVAHLADVPLSAEVALHIENAPKGLVASALATPLMLSLFSAAYQSRDPRELLDAKRFASRFAVEDHLVDLLVDAVYPDQDDHPWWLPPPWTSDQARTWLTFLAQHLHRHGERDLAWWRLARRTLSPWVAPALGVIIGVVVFAVATMLQPQRWRNLQDNPVAIVLASPPLLGTIFGAVVASLWLAGARRAPGRATVADRNADGFARGAATGALLVLIPGVPMVLTSSFGLDSFLNVVHLSVLAGALIALSLVSGLAVGLHELLVAGGKRTGKAGPEEFLRHDRRSALSLAVVTALVVGAFSALATTVGAALSGHIGERLAMSFGMATVAHLRLPPMGFHVPWSLDREDWPVLATASGLLMLLFALAVLTTRAWTRFQVARVVLAVTRKLPLRVMGFLADARERGLLRGAGGSYQFWHVRLQERLVASAVDERPPARRIPWPALTVLGGIVLLVLMLAARVKEHQPAGCRGTGWAGPDSRMTRTYVDYSTGCFALLTEDEWGPMAGVATDPAMLAKIKASALRPETFSDEVVIVGKLDRVPALVWPHLLEGISKAQGLQKTPIKVRFVFADAGSLADADLNVLVSYYLRWEQDSEKSLGVPRSVVAVDIDTAGSAVYQARQGYADGLVIGAKRIDLSAMATDYKIKVVASWLDNDGLPYALPARALADGVSDDECATLGKARSGASYDLRGVEPSMALLTRIAGCARVSLIVDQSAVAGLKAREKEWPSVNLLYVDDKSATIASDCAAALGAQAHDEAVSVCVATLAAATRFRVNVNNVLNA